MALSDTKRGEPRAHTADEIRQLLQRVHRETDKRFRLVRPFRGGEGAGAYEVESDHGPAVLKTARSGLTRAPLVANTLRELKARGYPVPTYVAFGDIGEDTYVIQTLLPGEPLNERFAGAHVPTVLALNELQTAAPATLGEWPARVVDPVLYGGEGYCLLDTMRRHSATTSELLDDLQATMSLADATPSGTDIVHLDFTSSNILGQEEEITGVIDWEATTTGDRAFDLVTLQFYVFNNRSIRDPLWTRALELAGPSALRVYFAHIIHRQVEWSIRFHEPTTVEHFLSLTRAVRAELNRL